ncbi:MAG: hypothetical protein AAGA65_02365 [Actinomycetota bacterium]
MHRILLNHRRHLMALFVTLLLLAAACGDDDDTLEAEPAGAEAEAPADDGDADAGDDDIDNDSDSDSDSDSDNDNDTDNDNEGAANDDSSDADESDDPSGGLERGPLDAGEHSTDLLGTSLSFTVDDGWELQEIGPGMVIFDDEDKLSPFSEGLVLFRPTGLAAGDEAVDGDPQAGDVFSGDPGDVAAWAAGLDEILIDDETVGTVAGRDAVITTFRLDPDGTAGLPGGCGPTEEDRCFMMTSTGSAVVPFLITRTTEVYRTWVVDLAPYDPLMIFGVANEAAPEWLDEVAGEVVDSITLGEPADRVDVEVNADGVLTQQFAPVEPGPWRVESLGTPFDFEVMGDWFTQPNEPGITVLTHPGSVGPGDRDVVFLRPRSLGNPATTFRNPTEFEGQPRDTELDLEQWIERVMDGVTVSAREPVSLGGLEGVAFDVRVDASVGCSPSDLCIDFVGVNNTNGMSFGPGFVFRVHWLDQGEFQPIAVVVGSPDGDAEWSDTAQAMLDTVTFGAAAPHPEPAD